MHASRTPWDIDSQEEKFIWAEVGQLAQQYRADVPHMRVAPRLNVGRVREVFDEFGFGEPRPWREVLSWLDRCMREEQVHPAHPRYFGLFNPAPAPLAIAGDVLTAAYNPQLAGWSHSPFANELERFLILQFGTRFGYPVGSIDGTFCTGGAEANHTALLCALTHRFPEYAEGGSRALPGPPVLYVSKYAHHSWMKAARACGLGRSAVQSIACDAEHRLNADKLIEALDQDERNGRYPVLICGTAGTTGAGIIDPLAGIATVAQERGCWYHVDAAWGGAARFVPEYQDWLAGIERADSITFDAHKFLSVPMGAGVFLTRHLQALGPAFTISTDYMPRDTQSLDVWDPYTHSMQWSRRFIGLKTFLPLASAGWTGLADTIRYQTQLGNRLRELLAREGWQCVNNTPLPVVCFGCEDKSAPLQAIADWVVESGRAWVSTVQLGAPYLRACITNFRSTEDDLIELVKALGDAKKAATQS